MPGTEHGLLKSAWKAALGAASDKYRRMDGTIGYPADRLSVAPFSDNRFVQNFPKQCYGIYGKAVDVLFNSPKFF